MNTILIVDDNAGFRVQARALLSAVLPLTAAA